MTKRAGLRSTAMRTNPVMCREAGGRGLTYTRTRARSHMLRAQQHNLYVYSTYVLLAGTTSVMAEASVGQATAGETSCASSCEENKCTSVNEVL